MKTAREVLLERHQAAAPKLDSIRNEVVNAELKGKGQASRLSPSENMRRLETGWKPVLQLLWRELIQPSRQIWAGLVAVWILLIGVNLSMCDRSPAGAMTSMPPTMMLTFREQERMLTELIGPDELRDAEPAPPPEPRPRSEGRIEIVVA